jgi:hypothetical protein
VLVAVVDRSGRGGTEKVKAAFEEVTQKYATRGIALRLPVTAEIARMAIMGASKSTSDRHTLFVSARAVESDLLDGLIAHEVGHMLRTEAGHPSHNAEVFGALQDEVQIPRAAEGAFGQAFNHVQDVYADDLAFLVFASDGGNRAYEFFAAWVDGNTSAGGTNRWQNIGLATSNGFAIGNLLRHRLIGPDDKLWDLARSFDRKAGFSLVDDLVAFYANLPTDPTPAAFGGEVRRLAQLMVRAAPT